MMKVNCGWQARALLVVACAVACWIAHATELDDFLARIADPNADVRAEAWKAAGAHGARAVKPLAELGASEDPVIAKAALAAIGTITSHAGRPGAPQERHAVAKALAEALDEAADDQLRRELLHYLGLVASDEHVPVLAALLDDPAVGEDARMALERVPGQAATRALLEALESSSEEVQVRVATALARRGAQEAVPVLIESAQNSQSRQVGFACLEALGAFGIPPHRVFPQRPSFSPGERQQYVRAALEAAYRLRENGENDEAAQIYENITVYSNEPEHIREALLGLDATGSEAFAAQALGYLFHPGVGVTAFRALLESGQSGLNDKLALAYEKSDPARKAALLQILHERGAPSVSRFLEPAKKEQNPELRATAMVLSGESPSLEDILTVAKHGSQWTRPHALELARERVAAMIAEGETERARKTCMELLESGIPEEYAVAAFKALGRLPGPETAAYLDSLNLWEPPRGVLAAALTQAELEAGQRAYVACAAAEENVDMAKERLLYAAEHSQFPSVTGMAVEKLAEMGVDSKMLAQRQGFITDWKVLGPFPNPNGTAFNRSFLDEAACRGEAPVEFEGKRYEWQPVDTDSVPAVIGLRGRLDPSENVAAYGYAEVKSPEPRDVIFQIGSDDGCEFWVNGVRLHGVNTPRGLTVDQDKVDAPLVAGTNRVLIKVLQGGVDWQFCVRVTDRAGVPIDLSE
ncbi:MAG: HEAT repeat domain-containing protein [Candidatus Hydrogenedentota bacterium]